MANTFKVVTKASVATSSGSPTTLYTVPLSTTTVVLALLLANKTTTTVKATVVLSSDTTVAGAGATNADVNLIYQIPVDDGNSLELLAGQKYVLQTSDILKIYADNANLDVTLSFMEMT